MTRKILSSITIITLITVLVSVILVTAYLYGYEKKSAEETLRNTVDIISESIDSEGGKYFENKEFKNIRITWIDKKGIVIFDSERNPSDLGNHFDRTEITQALEVGEGHSWRYSDTLMRTTLYYAKKINDGSILRISVDYPSFTAKLDSLKGLITAILLIAFLFSVPVSIFAARSVVKPINSLNLNNPENNYPELTPLLTKLREQNKTVNRQFSELKKNREQFNLITENMDFGLITTDPKTNILTCNSSAYRLLRIKSHNERQSIFSLNNSEVFRRCINDAMGGRHSVCILTTDSGDIEISASPSDTGMGNGIVVLIQDITEKQKLDTMRKEFTSNVSHELKTPLTTIYGISDMIAEGMVKSEDIQRFSADIRSEADRLISLINDTVSLSKLDENSVPSESEDIDLFELSSEITERLKKNAEKKDVSFSVIGEHIIFNGNKTIIDGIIFNLCDNAIKYNKENGHYEVKISHVPTKAFITVSDTGIGISEEHIGRIFERFYRADKSHSRKIGGTGLGLSIVKHGVMYHNGTIRVESTPDKGTAVIVELPMKNRG